MRAKTLLNQNARVIRALKYYRSRPKVSGYMWSGELELEKDGILYHFDMWYHGRDEMTEGEALDHVSLKAITYQGKYYDVYWHTVMTEDEIYLHPSGWFGFEGDKKVLEREVGAIRRANYNFERDTLSDQQRKELLSLGFIKIASLSGTGLSLPKPSDLFDKVRKGLPKLPGLP